MVKAVAAVLPLMIFPVVCIALKPKRQFETVLTKYLFITQKLVSWAVSDDFSFVNQNGTTAGIPEKIEIVRDDQPGGG